MNFNQKCNCIRNIFNTILHICPLPEMLKYIAQLNYNITLFIDQNNLIKKKDLSRQAARPAGPTADGPFSCQTFAFLVVSQTPLMSYDDLLYYGAYAGPNRKRRSLETSN